MERKKIITVLLVILLVAGCNDHTAMEGLLVVGSVSVGDQEMTPNARWMRFNADSTQQSGNGWLQHSYGTWSLNEETGELFVRNTNGLNDPYGPFKISVKSDTMSWTRNEEGQQVEILLERADSLPATYGDKLLGLWRLKHASGAGPNSGTSDTNDESNSFIFFRWDKQFVIGSEKGNFNGVYNVNGHRPELELIPYGKELNRNFWKIEYIDDTIKLNLLNNDSVISREFVRIHEFPE